MYACVNTSELESKKEKYHEIRNTVVEWYEKNCLDDEKESFNYDLTKKEDRLKLFLLGVFFNCVFQEDKALEIFKTMEKCGYLEFNELDFFERKIKTTLRNLEQENGRSYKILRVQDMIDSIDVLRQIFSRDGDVISIFHEKRSVEEFAKFLYDKLSGVKVKIFWIFRECRDLFNIPEEYCYVPDIHVTKLLFNIGFLEKRKTFSLEECLEISKSMYKYLGNEYFDLPFMRYHQRRCKNEKGCIQCKIDCRSKVQLIDTVKTSDL